MANGKPIPKKQPKSKLWTSKKADTIFSIWIRQRDKKCFFCPNPASQNSHFWGRGISATRYLPENCDGVCGGCHMRHEGSKQGTYRDMKIKQLGLDGYRKLEKLARQTSVKRSKAIQDLMDFMANQQ